MKYAFTLFFLIFFTKITFSFAQNETEEQLYFHNQELKEYIGFQEALKEPLEVQSFRLFGTEEQNDNQDTMLYHLAKFKNLKKLELSEHTLEQVLPYIKNLKNLQYLYYSTSHVLYLPKEIGELTSLVHLTLTNNELLALPVEIKNLKNLKFFACTNNEITTLPKEIGELENLLYLDFSQNDLKILPEELGNLTKLKGIRGIGNKIKTLPESIKYLKNLEKIDFINNKLTSIPESITQLKNLKEFVFINNQLKNLPAQIGNFTQLEKLEVSVNQLTTLPKSIGNLNKIINLDFTHNQLKTIPKEIGSLKNITSLNFYNNKLEEIPDEISNLENLIELDLGNNQLKNLPKGIENLPKLQTLRFGQNKIKDPFETLFTKDNNVIKTLECINNQIENISPNIKYLKAIKHFSLNNNNIIKLPTEISFLSTLESFIIENNKIVNLPAEIGMLTSLIHLNIDKNCLVDLPMEIKNLVNLTNLNISYNNFKKIPDEIFELSKLNYFEISFNKITQISPKITNLKNLNTLSANHNDITDLPNELFLMKNTFWNFEHNKIKKLSDSFSKNLQTHIETAYMNFSFKNNLFEELPNVVFKDSYKFKELIYAFLFNPIKNTPNNPQNITKDWLQILDVESGKIDLNANQDEFAMMSGKPGKIDYKYVYNNPNGKILYNNARKNHKKIQENTQIYFNLMDFEGSEEDKIYVKPYLAELLPFINLIRTDLYGAGWYIENKDFKTATKILGEIKKTLKNFEIKTNDKNITKRLDFITLQQDQAQAYWEEVQKNNQNNTSNELSEKEISTTQKLEKWKSVFFETSFLSKKYATQLKKNKKLTDESKEKKYATNEKIIIFFLNILPEFYKQMEILEKKCVK